MPQGRAYGTAINLPAGRQAHEYRASVTSGHYEGKDSAAVRMLQGEQKKTLEEKAVFGERELSKSVPHHSARAGLKKKEIKDTLGKDDIDSGGGTLQSGAIVGAEGTVGNDTVESVQERGSYSKKRASKSILGELPKRKTDRYKKAPYEMSGFSGGRNKYAAVHTQK